MKGSEPPRLAVVLLQWCLDDNEPLTGDLLEEFAARQSRLWFWRQVLLAIVIHSFQRHDEQRPLGLPGLPSFLPVERVRRAETRRINLTASPLPDIGGLGLVSLGAIVAVARPAVLWLFLPAILGGVAFGLTLVLVRRRTILSGPAADSRTIPRDSSGGQGAS